MVSLTPQFTQASLLPENQIPEVWLTVTLIVPESRNIVGTLRRTEFDSSDRTPFWELEITLHLSRS